MCRAVEEMIEEEKRIGKCSIEEMAQCADLLIGEVKKLAESVK